jgi:hypothetical protein
MAGRWGSGSWIKKAMFEYTKRGDFRNCFPHLKQNRLPAAVTVVRRIGPMWIVAGRRPRVIPVFVVRTFPLSARAAS